MWSWKIAHKIKLFTRLAIVNKIPNWDTLQLKEWEGPSICQVCTSEAETALHLFIKCTFTRQVWDRIKN
jgi:hypothetical protein